MRIDLVISELFVGGAERCLTELAIGLNAGGDRVRVISIGSLPSGPQRSLVNRLEADGIEVVSCQADSPLRFFAALGRLQAVLRQSPPDLVQTFLFHANVVGTLAARSAGVSACIGGIRVAEARVGRVALERWVAKKMHRVVCVSRGVERFARRRLGCAQQQTVVIPNGVDVDRFSHVEPTCWSQFGWPADSLVTLFVGRFHRQKGIDLIQQQVDAIAPAGSNRRLLLVGDGPQRESITSWAGRLGDQRVQVLPWQSDVRPLLRAARVVVLPSRYEGMPNVVLEAMACGRPVVCSDVQGVEELFGRARSTQVFPPGDSDAMKALIEQFLRDEALCNSTGAANQRRVRREFSLPAMVDSYRRLYREVLARRSGHGASLLE